MRSLDKFLATTALAAGVTLVTTGAVLAQAASSAPGNPSTQQMIEQLKPHTRGLIIGGGSAPPPAAPATPAPSVGMTAPMAPASRPAPSPAATSTASAPRPATPPATAAAIASPVPAPAPVSAPASGQSKPSLNLRVLFGFNSADLTPEARTTLDNLGRALQSNDLKNSRFEVAGHTDAVGNDDTNRKLSEDRAAAVKNYLVTNYGVDPSRIQSVGHGKADLFDPAHPASSVNRRVQVTNLSAAG